MFEKTIWPIIKETFAQWLEDSAPRLAAALSYYTTFAIAPLLVIVIGVAGLVFGEDAVRGRLDRQISQLVGNDAATMIGTMVRSASNPESGVLATILGSVTLLVGATGVFVELQDALNIIWKVKPRKGSGVRKLLKSRAISFAMVLGIGFLLLVSLVVSAGLAALTEFMGDLLPHSAGLVQVLDFVVAFGVTTLLFAVMFRVLPDTDIRWSDVWPGAGITALLFTIGRFLIGLYLGRSTITSAYGAAGSLAVVLVWIYYSSQILFLGAEFVHVYTHRHGSRCSARQAIEPMQTAKALRAKRR